MHDQTSQNQDHTTDSLSQRRALLAGIGGLAAGALLASKAHAGPLNPPPGPIAPTPGPEPRIPINQTNTPGNASAVFRITQPGSYYLTGNVLGEPGKNGIVIASNHVRLDLNGFALIGVSNALNAILGTNGVSNLAVCNGTVTAWPQNGISLAGGASTNMHAERIIASGNGQTGIVLGNCAMVRDCVAQGNSGGGFAVRTNSHLADCTALTNSGDAFVVEDSSSVVQCIARQNAGRGIVAGSACTISRCTVRASGAVGMTVQTGCSVTDNTLQDNQSGLTFRRDNTVARNNVVRTVAIPGSFGIRAEFDSNRIEANNVNIHAPGIILSTGGNLLLRNSVLSADPYSISPGNTVGPIVDNGNIATNNNPHANYSY